MGPSSSAKSGVFMIVVLILLLFNCALCEQITNVNIFQRNCQAVLWLVRCPLGNACSQLAPPNDRSVLFIRTHNTVAVSTCTFYTFLCVYIRTVLRWDGPLAAGPPWHSGVNNLIQTPGNENFSTKRRKNWLRSTARGLVDFVLRTGSNANLWPRPQYSPAISISNFKLIYLVNRGRIQPCLGSFWNLN